MKNDINDSSGNTPQYQSFCQVVSKMVWKKCVPDGTSGREQPKEAFHQQNTIAKCGVYKMDPERSLIKYKKQS